MSREEETNQLVDDGIGFAEQMLVEHGEFIPYGMIMLKDGTTQMVAGDVGKEKPESQDVIDLLKENFRQRASAGEIRASAVFYEVATKLPSTGEDADAIAAAIDHQDNYSVIVLYPYKVIKGQVAHAPAFAQAGAGGVF